MGQQSGRAAESLSQTPRPTRRLPCLPQRPWLNHTHCRQQTPDGHSRAPTTPTENMRRTHAHTSARHNPGAGMGNRQSFPGGLLTGSHPPRNSPGHGRSFLLAWAEPQGLAGSCDQLTQICTCPVPGQRHGPLIPGVLNS